MMRTDRGRFACCPQHGYARVAAGLLVAVLLANMVSYFSSWSSLGSSGPAAQKAPPTSHTQSRMTPQAVSDLLYSLREVNYYPAGNAQINMWLNFDPAQIDQDFAQIAALNANTVRIVVFTSTFGYPTPSARMSNELTQVIQLADAHHLRVQLTLFGFWRTYTTLAHDETWASNILKPYANDRRIAYIDLQNEIDPSNSQALTWAKNMLPYVRNIMGSVPITISVSGTAGIGDLQQLMASQVPLDFFDLHYYGPATQAYETFQQARMVVSPALLYIGEAGYSTFLRNDQDSATREEACQDQYLRTVEYAAQAAGLPKVAPWIVNDFAQGAFPTTNVSKSGADPAEYAFGLFRTDGTAKPAAASMASIFAGNSIDLALNYGFEANDGTGLPTNWQRWQPSAATFALDPQVAHTGGSSARISQSSSTSTGLPAFYVSPVQPIIAGQSYTVSVWARDVDATGITYVALGWFDAAGKYISTTTSAKLPNGTTDWTQLTLTAQAPSNAASLQIHLVSANNSGTAWFDDVSFAPAA